MKANDAWTNKSLTGQVLFSKFMKPKQEVDLILETRGSETIQYGSVTPSMVVRADFTGVLLDRSGQPGLVEVTYINISQHAALSDHRSTEDWDLHRTSAARNRLLWR